MIDTPFTVVLAGGDRATAPDEEAALRAARELRDDRYRELGTQGSSLAEVNIYFTHNGNEHHVLTIARNRLI